MKRIVFSAPCIKRYETDEFQPSESPVFAAVSITGDRCELLCDHCRTRMLGALYKAKTPEGFLTLAENLNARGCRGILVTGGCDTRGTIPFPEFSEAIHKTRLEYSWRLAVHTKLLDRPFAEALTRVKADLLMLDLVGEEATLREVYHLRDRSVMDIVHSLDLAAEYRIPIAPHLVIGLHGGEIRGEYRALELLEGRDFEALVLVVLCPLRGTPFEGKTPEAREVLAVMEKARQMFSDRKILLGCAKTSGPLQRTFEEKALELGFEGIAYPSEGIIARAEEMGYLVEKSELCCAFVPWAE